MAKRSFRSGLWAAFEDHSGVGRAGWVGVQQLSSTPGLLLPPFPTVTHEAVPDPRGVSYSQRTAFFSRWKYRFRKVEDGLLWKLTRMTRWGRDDRKLLSLTLLTRLLPMLQSWKQIQERQGLLGGDKAGVTDKDCRTDTADKGDMTWQHWQTQKSLGWQGACM